MHTHDASGVTHINASDPSDRRLVIFELVEYDILVVPDHRRGLAELNILRQVMVLAVCELYVTMHHGCMNENGTHRRCLWHAGIERAAIAVCEPPVHPTHTSG